MGLLVCPAAVPAVGVADSLATGEVAGDVAAGEVAVAVDESGAEPGALDGRPPTAALSAHQGVVGSEVDPGVPECQKDVIEGCVSRPNLGQDVL